MATNPRVPSDPNNQKRPELVPAPVVRKKWPGAGPGVAFALIVAAALIAAVVYYMPRAPKKSPPPAGAQAPIQPVSNELQFSNLHIALGPAGSEMTLDGSVMNAGNRPILGSTVELTFLGHDGKVVGNVTKPLQGMMVQNGLLRSDPIGTHPIPPNHTRPFRITVDNVPSGWNHQMPNVTVLTVAAD